jgi:hypothetical protein
MRYEGSPLSASRLCAGRKGAERTRARGRCGAPAHDKKPVHVHRAEAQRVGTWGVRYGL